MPHCILEYSNNIVTTVNTKQFFHELHQLLVTEAGIDISNIKSRTVVYDQFFIGDGRDDHAFIHLTVSILSGRHSKEKQNLGHKILAYLATVFATSKEKVNCSITLELREMERETYFKVNSMAVAQDDELVVED